MLFESCSFILKQVIENYELLNIAVSPIQVTLLKQVIKTYIETDITVLLIQGLAKVG